MASNTPNICIRRRLVALLCTSIVAGCGGGSGGGNETSTPPVAGPTPAPPATALLTNAQLGTAEDANAAITEADAMRWFGENSKIVRSLTEASDFSDLAFFEPLVANKSLVMLGESGHGVDEYSMAKLRLIRYLHEQQGFDVLAFEAGLFDCERSQEVIENAPTDSDTALNAMRTCLFPLWNTTTVRELFDYVRSTHDTARPLRVTGFDVQFSGSKFTERARRTAALFEKISPERALEVSAIEGEFRRLITAAGAAATRNDPAIAALRSALPDIRNDYAVMADELMASMAQITADGEFAERDVLIAAQYTRTAPYNAEQFTLLFDGEPGWRVRDAGMALNLIALKEQIYPGEKIITWAHNAHIRHRGSGFVPDGNVGKLVHDVFEDQMYTIGFYMYRGRHAFNDGEIRTILPPQNRSLEAIFHSRRLRWLFLDLENAPASQGHEWINQQTPTYAWGEFSLSLRLAQEYDGLFIIDTVAPPTYLN